MSHEIHTDALFVRVEGENQQCIQVLARVEDEICYSWVTRTAVSAHGHGARWESMAAFQERIRDYTPVPGWPDPPPRLR